MNLFEQCLEATGFTMFDVKCVAFGCTMCVRGCIIHLFVELRHRISFKVKRAKLASLHLLR